MMQLSYNHIIIPLQTGEVALLDESGKCVGRYQSVSEAVRHAKELNIGQNEDFVGMPIASEED